MEILHAFGPHRGIDGIAEMPDGRIVAACGWKRSGKGPRVAMFAPSGAVLAEYPLPSEPTNVCPAEAEALDLYVTSNDGSLWHMRLES